MVDPDFANAVSRLLKEYLRSSGAPGAALSVMKDGKVLFSTAEGFANRESGAPMSTATLFGAGSITKTLTALVFLILEREGFLHLDDPVSVYLPRVEEDVQYIEESEPAQPSPLLLYHLLSHTSGIPEMGFGISHLFRLCGVKEQGPYEIDDVDGLFSGLVEAARLRYQRPGKKFLYSNENFILLAKIAELVTGTPFAELVQTRILVPLGMLDSSIGFDDPGRLKDCITGYFPGASGPMPIPFHVPPAIFGAGGLVTSIDDLSHYLGFLLENGVIAGQDISGYSPTLWNKVIPKDWVPGRFYGLGWYIQENEFCEPLIYHGGDLLFSGGICMLLPESHMGIVLGQNTAGSPVGFDFACKVLRLLKQDGDQPVCLAESADNGLIAAKDLVGVYNNHDCIYTVEVTFKDGILKLRPQLPGVGSLPELSFAAENTSPGKVEFKPVDYPPPSRRSGCVFIRSNNNHQVWLQYEDYLFLRSTEHSRNGE